MPKLRGRGKNSNKTIQSKPITIPLTVIELSFENGEKVTPKTLIQKGVITIMKGRTPNVKILGVAPITKKVNVTGCEVSATAKASIEKVGGTVTA
jgi:ribosomal protein L15